MISSLFLGHLPAPILLVNLFDEVAVHLPLQLIEISERIRLQLHRKIQQPMVLLVLFENLFVRRNPSLCLIWVSLLSSGAVPDGRDFCALVIRVDDELRAAHI